MAHVSGPVRTLPGTVTKSPADTECDSCTTLALSRIQGETDSFGAEYSDACQNHYDKYLDAIKDLDTTGTCDWCKNHNVPVKDHRDFEEGSCGRIYQVCDTCIAKEKVRIEEY